MGGDGQIHTTFDGGETWISSEFSDHYFRSVGFLNSSVGFTGSLEGNVYKTTDGGITWDYITEKFPVEKPVICGISCVDGIVFATGNFTEPAEFFKSYDQGESWEYTMLDSLLSAAVEVQFLNPQEGYISGMGLSGRGAIIYTIDGGTTWKIVCELDFGTNYIWKLSLLESGKAYGSVQNFHGGGPTYVKRNSATEEWIYHSYGVFGMDPQGMGFLDDETGWIGSYYGFILETNDGGDTWKKVDLIESVNRIVKLNDNTMLAIGKKLYIYDAESTSTVDHSEVKSESLPHSIVSITPNPSKDFIKIEYELSNRTLLTVDIFDLRGSKVKHITKGEMSKGLHENSVDISDLVAGQYFITIRTSERHLVEKFLIVR